MRRGASFILDRIGRINLLDLDHEIVVVHPLFISSAHASLQIETGARLTVETETAVNDNSEIERTSSASCTRIGMRMANTWNVPPLQGGGIFAELHFRPFALLPSLSTSSTALPNDKAGQSGITQQLL